MLRALVLLTAVYQMCHANDVALLTGHTLHLRPAEKEPIQLIDQVIGTQREVVAIRICGAAFMIVVCFDRLIDFGVMHTRVAADGRSSDY